MSQATQERSEYSKKSPRVIMAQRAGGVCLALSLAVGANLAVAGCGDPSTQQEVRKSLHNNPASRFSNDYLGTSPVAAGSQECLAHTPFTIVTGINWFGARWQYFNSNNSLIITPSPLSQRDPDPKIKQPKYLYMAGFDNTSQPLAPGDDATRIYLDQKGCLYAPMIKLDMPNVTVQTAHDPNIAPLPGAIITEYIEPADPAVRDDSLTHMAYIPLVNTP